MISQPPAAVKPPAATLVASKPAAVPKPTALVGPGPMTREQYEAEASRVRQVVDPLTGRVRLVKGAGEILEQIVSKSEQRRIQQLATRWDGRLMYGAPGER